MLYLHLKQLFIHPSFSFYIFRCQYMIYYNEIGRNS